ncbi:hypothetical protein MMC29_003660 [Sticta canariensis]|nr:hypothetical protein [Sticta canariensis]
MADSAAGYQDEYKNQFKLIAASPSEPAALLPRRARDGSVANTLIIIVAEGASLNDLPRDPHEWTKLARHHGVLHRSIHDLSILDSASKIKGPQFYALRVLGKPHKKLLDGSDLCDRRVLAEARKFLDEWQAWKDYLKDIEINGGSSSLSEIEDIRTFSLVRYNQMRTSTNDHIDSASLKVVLSPVAHRTRSHQPNPAHSGSPYTPTRMPLSQKEKQPFSMGPLDDLLNEMEKSQFNTVPHGSNAPPSPESPANTAETLPSEDEQIVNMALILFLDSVTIHHPKVKSGGSSSPRWTIKRLQLKFGTWEARTAGFLRMASDNQKLRLSWKQSPTLESGI